MHTTTQNWAHRATLARTKPRWQPYTPTPSQILHLKTPAITPSSVPASPQPAQNAANVPPNAPQSHTPSTTTPSHPPSKEPRDANKNKFAAGLIDQAVKLLTEVWRPDVIPQAFRPPRPSPPTNQTSGPTESIGKQRQSQAGSQTPSSASSDVDSDGPLLPIRPFIHEVLRRSRTSATVLQTALCYLEAVRPKIPEIASLERSGVRYAFEPETRIMPATEAELAREVELAKLEAESALASPNETTSDTTMSDFVGTVKATDEDHLDTNSSASDSSSMFTGASTHTTTATSVPPAGSDSNPARAMKPTADGPSPLLCPRRAFLSALILASKFSQDKSYSNRAWAKLSGLPAREVGRCERALGQALEWRLWVGKKSTAEVTPSPPAVKPVVRARTEGSIASGPTISHRGPFLSSQDLGPGGSNTPSTTSAKIQLRRSGTLPPSSFKFGVNVTMVPPKTLPSGRTLTPSLVHDAALGAMLTPQGLASASIPHLDAYALGAMASSNATYTQSPESYAGLTGPGSSPGTPGLSYSPSCTEVSSGSQTVLVASLEDDMLTSYNPSQPWSNSADSNILAHKHSVNTQSKGDSVPSANANGVRIVFTEDNNPFVPVWGRDSGSVAVGAVSAF